MTDEQLVALWLHGRPATTRRTYRSAIDRVFWRCSLQRATLAELQEVVDKLDRLAPRSRALTIAAIKSFYGFHAAVGVLQANPALGLRPPKVPTDLADRILTAEDTRRLIAAAPVGQARVMLRLLYTAGLRAAELCGLRWGALARGQDGAGSITVIGKGQKRRTVQLPAEAFGDLAVLEPDDAGAGDPIFPSATDPDRPIGTRQLLRVVKRAAKAAGLTDKVSSHWMRHCHASHALDAGCPITTVRDTLGHSNLTVTNRYAHAKPGDGSARFLTHG